MLHQTPWPRLRELYRLGEVSPVDGRSALEHAERADPIINAFALLDRAGALAGARIRGTLAPGRGARTA